MMRRINVTDALFFNLLANGETRPLSVRRIGLRGTQNINKNKEQVEVNIVQVTDTAKTDHDAEGLLVRCAISFMPLGEGLRSCTLSKNDKKELLSQFRESYFSFIYRAGNEKAISKGLQEVANRYARNIANGRWLWRNRQFAQTIEITVKCGAEVFTFNALDISTREFKGYSKAEKTLGLMIANQLVGISHDSIEIEARLSFGSGMSRSVEVYPSQNYLGNERPKGFSRSLYAVGTSDLKTMSDLLEFDASRLVGQAALRDTKVANALRSFDTWYEEFENLGQPIPVEPTGANIDAQRTLRNKDNSSFAYARRLNKIDVNSDEGMFMIAALIRGGVYSQGDEKS